MEHRILEVQRFLESGRLPESLVTPTQKRDFRRRAQSFVLEGHNLIFIRPGKRSLVVLDRKDRLELIKQAHVTSSGLHCTLKETKKKISSRYYWPTLVRDVTKWVKQCNSCQKSRSEKSLPMEVKPCNSCQKTRSEKSLPIQGVSKSHRIKDPLPVLQVEEVTQAFEQVGLGVVGPLEETAEGFRFILLSVDAYSRWVEATPLKEQNPAEVAGALIPFLLRFGRPQLLVTTLRVPFVNQVNRSLQRQLQGMGVPLGKLDIVMSAFQPKINSILSLTSSCIRKTLWNLVKGELEKWDQVLDRALFSLRTAVTKNKRRSPFQLLYGRKPRGPQEVPAHFDVVAADNVGDTHDNEVPTEPVETTKHMSHLEPKHTGQPKEDTVQESAQQPVEGPAQQPMVGPPLQPVVGSIQQPLLQPMHQPLVALTRQPVHQPMAEFTQQPMNQPMVELTQQPLNQPLVELTQQPVHQSMMELSQQPMNQPMAELTQQPVHQPMAELTRQSMNQPMAELTQQPILQPSQQPMVELPQQPMHPPVAEPRQPSRPETMGQVVHQPIAEPINQHIWQPMLGSIYQPIHQPIQQPLTHVIQQSMYQPMYQPIQQPMHQSLQQPITQSIQHPMLQSMQQPIMAEPIHPHMQRLAECPIMSGWGQRTTPSLDAPWEKWEPGGGAFWTQWRDPGN